MDRMERVLDRLRRQAGAREARGDGGGGAGAGGGAAHARPEPHQLVHRRLHPRLVDLAGNQRLGRGRHERRPRRRPPGRHRQDGKSTQRGETRCGETHPHRRRPPELLHGRKIPRSALAGAH